MATPFLSLLLLSWSCMLPVTSASEQHKPQRDLQTPQTKIVGGNIVTDPQKYPFFLEWEDAKCGASLIHDDIALSAAHCESEDHPFDTRVFLLGVDSETGISRLIERQVAHPLYTGAVQDYDFVLLKLTTSALVDANGVATGAATISLNSNPNVPQVGDALTGVGYGKLDPDDTETSEQLNEVEIYYVSNEVCMQQYGPTDYVPELMFCAGVTGGGKDTCQGDSGGPIIDQATNTQVGVVSFGIGCAEAEYAGVNSRVSAVHDWINATICELTDYPPSWCNVLGTLPPDVLPSGGVGKIGVAVRYDDYPEETAWTLTYLSMPNQEPLQLFLHPFSQTNIPDRSYDIKSFANLPAGTYSLRFGDSAGDGVCCVYGPGNVALMDDLTGTTIWRSTGAFGDYVEVQFEMNAAGAIVILQEDFDYDNSWEALQAVNHPPTQDAEWPGAFPSDDRNTVMLNVKFDAYPEEVDWSFYTNPSGTSWSEIEDLDGSKQGVHNSIVSVEVDDLAEGWHRFSVRDSSGDGVCCSYRRGWVSITAPIITTRLKGLVWGNNGEFGSGIDIYIFMDAEGFINQVSYADPFLSGTARSTSIRRSPPGGGRQLELERSRDISSYTDLPKQQIKLRPSQRS